MRRLGVAIWQWERAEANYSRLAISVAEIELISEVAYGTPVSQIGAKEFVLDRFTGFPTGFTLGRASRVRLRQSGGDRNVSINLNRYGRVFTSAIDPSGTMYISMESTNTVAIRKLNGNSVLTPELPHDSELTAARFSPDGAQVATGTSNGSIQIWDLHTKEMIAALPTGKLTPVVGLRFTEDQKHLVGLTDNSVITVWNTRRWQKLESRSAEIIRLEFEMEGSKTSDALHKFP